jgi:uncharacterized Zn-finger protein
MKFTDLKNFLNEENGQHTTNIYIPSIKRDIPFKPLTTANVKTLSRIGVFSDFDLNNELLKLALFDKLSIETKESCGVDADSLTQIDFLSFLIGLRRLMDNTLTFSFTCQNCENEFKHTLDLEAEFSKYIYSYQRKNFIFEKIDKNDRIWKFELESYTMKEYLYYRYYIERMKEIDTNNPDVLNEASFIRPVLYIKRIWLDDSEIEDWNEQILSNKIKLINSLPSEVIIDIKNEDNPNDCLATFVRHNFDEEKMFVDIDKLEVTCPHCKEVYNSLFDFDDFFTF